MKKVKVYSPKHQVVEAEREGMPLSVSADCLSDPKGKTTNAFRKECWRSRERIFVPTQKPKPGYPQRKIAEKSFKQLGILSKFFQAISSHTKTYCTAGKASGDCDGGTSVAYYSGTERTAAHRRVARREHEIGERGNH